MKLHNKVMVLMVSTLMSAGTIIPLDSQDNAAWFTYSRDDIKDMATKEIANPGAINTTSSPVHAAVSRMVKTYNELSAFRKQQDDIKRDEWQKREDTRVAENRFDEVNLYPTNFAIGWCECISAPERMSFVAQIVRDALRNYPNLNQQLVYTSLGSGELLQDLLTIQELVYAGYTDIVVNTIEHEYKDKMLPTLSQFRKKLVNVQVARINAGFPVRIVVRPYISVATYAAQKPKNEKINVMALVDIGARSADFSQPLPKYINQVEIQINENNDGFVDEGTVIEDLADYVMILSPVGTNYGYVKIRKGLQWGATSKMVDDVLHKIVAGNIKSAEQIKKMLKPLENDTTYWQEKNLFMSVLYGTNVLYDLNKLCAFADRSAIVRYFTSNSKSVIAIRPIDPKTFNPDDLIREEMIEDGYESMNDFLKADADL